MPRTIAQITGTLNTGPYQQDLASAIASQGLNVYAWNASIAGLRAPHWNGGFVSIKDRTYVNVNGTTQDGRTFSGRVAWGKLERDGASAVYRAFQWRGGALAQFSLLDLQAADYDLDFDIDDVYV